MPKYIIFTKAIYNIGTEILYFQCFFTTKMIYNPKSIIPAGGEISRRFLQSPNAKRRFKAISKNMDFRLKKKRPPGGRLSAEVYNFTKAIYDIGTEILYFQCFLTTDIFYNSQSIILAGSEISRRFL